MIQGPSLLKHLRDILILPFTVTVIVPYCIYTPDQHILPDHPLSKGIGVLLLLSGVTLFGYTVYLFRTFGKGTLAPWTPTQQLVITGPYKYCRNPMITGVLSILIGEALIFHSSSIALWACAFLVINTCYFIFKEEPDLYRRFGEPYKRYKAHVPRWIPKVQPYRGN